MVVVMGEHHGPPKGGGEYIEISRILEEGRFCTSIEERWEPTFKNKEKLTIVLGPITGFRFGTGDGASLAEGKRMPIETAVGPLPESLLQICCIDFAPPLHRRPGRSG